MNVRGVSVVEWYVPITSFTCFRKVFQSMWPCGLLQVIAVSIAHIILRVGHDILVSHRLYH